MSRKTRTISKFLFVAASCTAIFVASFAPAFAQGTGEQWRPQGKTGFGETRSNLYQQGLTPIPSKDANKPTKLLNFVTPQDGVQATPASQAQDESAQPPRRRQESIDGILGDLDRDDRQSTPPEFPQSHSASGAEIVRQRYPDGKIQVEREVVQDKDGNYQNHGWWKLYNKSGQVIGDGIFEHGLMEGPWKRLHNEKEGGIFASKPFDLFRGPFLSTATFEHGKLAGTWQIFDRSQRKAMEITYSSGKRHGPATWWYPNGAKMREMTFHDGLLDGKVIEWDTSGKIIRDEEYIEGRKVSTATTEHSEGRRKTSIQSLEPKLVLADPDDWWDAKPAPYKTEGEAFKHGPFMAWFENGQLEMQGQFFDDRREGPFTWWHANGQKSVAGHYKKGNKSGVWIWWHANGMKSHEGRFEDDNRVGTWMSWNEDGKLIDREDLTPDDQLPNPKEKPKDVPSNSSETETPEKPAFENLNGEPTPEVVEPLIDPSLEGETKEIPRESGDSGGGSSGNTQPSGGSETPDKSGSSDGKKSANDNFNPSFRPSFSNPIQNNSSVPALQTKRPIDHNQIAPAPLVPPKEKPQPPRNNDSDADVLNELFKEIN